MKLKVFLLFYLISSSLGMSQGRVAKEDLTYQLFFAGGLDAQTVVQPHSSPMVTSTLPMAQSLLSLIKSAKKSVDFAIYGLRNQCEVLEALKSAQNRGVVVRGIIDQNSDGTFDYIDQNQCDTRALFDAFGSQFIKNDINPSTGNAYSYIMHNKFFIIDDEIVSTGSTNISETCLGGEYNANWMIHLNSKNLAKVYKTEFEEMWIYRLTHKKKKDNTQHVLAEYTDGSKVESYFAPTDNAQDKAIIPAIQGAKRTLDIAIFFMTSDKIAQAVVAAKQRGVDVRVIIDALGAANVSSDHKLLCDQKIPVKIENWNGKMHMKALVADQNSVIIGSQNFTAAGNDTNDENTLWIKGQVAQKIAIDYQQYFQSLWDSIPDRFICFNPRAESLNSGSTCSDGVDNDYDGDIDALDSGCQP